MPFENVHYFFNPRIDQHGRNLKSARSFWQGGFMPPTRISFLHWNAASADELPSSHFGYHRQTMETLGNRGWRRSWGCRSQDGWWRKNPSSVRNLWILQRFKNRWTDWFCSSAVQSWKVPSSFWLSVNARITWPTCSGACFQRYAFVPAALTLVGLNIPQPILIMKHAGEERLHQTLNSLWLYGW